MQGITISSLHVLMQKIPGQELKYLLDLLLLEAEILNQIYTYMLEI